MYSKELSELLYDIVKNPRLTFIKMVEKLIMEAVSENPTYTDYLIELPYYVEDFHKVQENVMEAVKEFNCQYKELGYNLSLAILSHGPHLELKRI